MHGIVNNGPKKRSNGLGAVWHDKKSGAWRWAVTLGFNAKKQKRIVGTVKTKTLAQKALAAAITEHAKNGIAEPDKITLGEWLDKWLASKTNISANTHARWESIVRLHIKPTLGSKRLQNIKPIDLNSFYTELAKPRLDSRKGHKSKEIILSARTLGHIHGVLFGAFKTALRLEIIARNPSDILRPEIQSQDNSMRAAKSWTPEEAGKFLKAAQADELYTLFYLLLSLGLRRGEVCGLRWQNIDLENRKLSISEARVCIKGEVHTTKPKTEKSKRRLKLPLEVVDQLQIFQRIYNRKIADLKENGITPTQDWLFITDTGQALHPDNVNRSLRRLAKFAGVRAIRVHDLRHTYASLARRHGVPLEIVSEKLGHARPSFTADVYRHTFEDEHEAAAVNLSELLNIKPQAQA